MAVRAAAGGCDGGCVVSEELCRHDMNPAWCGDCHSERTVRCRTCNRPLDDPMSQMLQSGPHCFDGDVTAQAKILDKIAKSPTGWVRSGVVGLHTAQQWSHALKKLEGVDGGYRYDDESGKGYRVYAGRPNVPVFYVTFGQRYRHEAHELFPVAHPDGYLVLEAETEDLAREGAFKLCKAHWAFMYTAEQWAEPSVSGETVHELWPRGELARFRVTARPSGAIGIDPSGIVS